MAFFSRKRIAIASLTAFVALGAAAGVFFWGGDNSASAKTAATQYGILKDDRTLGAPYAPVVIIEYASPSCPHCAHFNETVFPRFKKDYIDTGKVLYTLRVYPIMSVDGAIEAVARCLPADKYYPYLDKIFRGQSKWDPEYNVPDARPGLLAISAPFGINEARFNQCVSNKDAIDRLNRVAQDGQMRYNIESVPSFIINGTVVQFDPLDYDHFRAKVEEALKKH